MYAQKYDDTEEKSVLISLRSGCQRAFRQVYTRYSGRIYLYTHKMVKSVEEVVVLLKGVFI